MRSQHCLFVSAFATATLVCACASHTYSNGRGGNPTNAVQPSGPGVPIAQADPGREALDAIVRTVLARSPQPTSVACLPLVTYAESGKSPFVSVYGESFADTAASQLAAGGFRGFALNSDAVGLRVASINGTRASFSTLESAAAQGERLGVDGVVFGTIERRSSSAAPGAQTLRGKVFYYDVAERRVVDTRSFEAASDRQDLVEMWRKNREESSWSPDSGFAKLEPSPSLDRELELVARQLVQFVTPQIQRSKASGSAYVATTDTAAFVRSIERLRAAQKSLVAESARREARAKDTQTPVDGSSPLLVEGERFPSVQAAEDFVHQLERSVAGSEAGRFAASISAMIAQEARAVLEPMSIRVTDPGFTRPMERFVVDDALATGSLASSPAAREALKKAGVGLVFAPRIERIGSTYRIRLDVLDVGAQNLVASTFVPLHGSFADELTEALGKVANAEPVPSGTSGPAPSTAWNELYPRVKSGVVELAGPKGQGTGFVVRKDGYVMTARHVIDEEGVGRPFQAVFQDGTRAACTVVAEEPFLDVAIVRIDAQMPAATHVFGFASEAPVGTAVAVLGRPKSTQGWVLTPGSISSVDERVPSIGSTPRPSSMYTCATACGSSGSPVVLSDGRVAAIHAPVVWSSDDRWVAAENPSYAVGVPARDAKQFLDAWAARQ